MSSEPNISWPLAMQCLNDQDIKRLACIYLYTGKDGTVDWDTAAREFGSASKDAFKKMVSTAMKKIKEASEKQAKGEISVSSATGGGNGNDGDGSAAVPKKNNAGRKRSAGANNAAGDSGTVKKPRGPGKKAKEAETPIKDEESHCV